MCDECKMENLREKLNSFPLSYNCSRGFQISKTTDPIQNRQLENVPYLNTIQSSFTKEIHIKEGLGTVRPNLKRPEGKLC